MRRKVRPAATKPPVAQPELEERGHVTRVNELVGFKLKAVWEDWFLLVCHYGFSSIYCHSWIDTRCDLVLQKPDSKRHDAILLYLHFPVRTQPELLNKGFDSRLMLNLRGTPFSALKGNPENTPQVFWTFLVKRSAPICLREHPY
jgi:hypothetical protein